MTGSRGQIITFYSYKGGTGRTMSLANIACILAKNQKTDKSKGVLMIDWDLEAPGLHRFFQDMIIYERKISEESFENEPGLIDLFYELNKKVDDSLYTARKYKARQKFSSDQEELAHNIINTVNFDKYISSAGIENLHLLKAGRFSSIDTNQYPEQVNKFDWEDLYKKSPPLIRMVADKLAEKYSYVLIDSRTGVTDISGICTTLLPEKLVIVFTPNTQSIEGAIDVARRAADYRKESADLRPLIIFPFVSRVETTETVLRHDWRQGNRKEGITGYQPAFQDLLTDVYLRENQENTVNLSEYFDEMQVPHIPRYAFGEKIAILDEGLEDKFSLRLGYKTFTNKLIEDNLPWEGKIEHPSRDEEKVNRKSKKETNIKSSFLGTDPIKTLQIVFLLFALFSGIYIYFLYTQSVKDFAIANKQNADLQQRIFELEKMSPLIEEKNKDLLDKEAKINELYNQINSTGTEKDKTIFDLQQQLEEANSTSISANKSSQNYQERADKYLDRALYAEKMNNDLKLQKQEAEKELEICKGQKPPQ